MTALLIVGALLWSFVLFAVLRRVTEQRRARRAWLAQRAEEERLWQADVDEQTELWRQLRHKQCMAALERIAQ
jgi:hypothetical protein